MACKPGICGICGRAGNLQRADPPLCSGCYKAARRIGTLAPNRPTRLPVEPRAVYCPGCADVPRCGRPADPHTGLCARCAPPARPTARHWTDRPAHRGAEPPKLPGSPTFRRDNAGLAARLFGPEPVLQTDQTEAA